MPKELTKKKLIIVGVTGQLATGKSTVAAMFAAFGAGVINADLLAHRALRPLGGCYLKVVKVFGKDILTDGQIDRAKLAARVFANLTELKKLEKIIHPFVIRETRKEILLFKKAGKKVVVLDVPLLFESGMDKLADITLVVKTNRTIQMARVKAQGRLSATYVFARIRMQWPMAQKARRADIIIDNGGSRKETQKYVKQVWEMINRRYID